MFPQSPAMSSNSDLCEHCDKHFELNPDLCDSCQPWNNLTHLLQCIRLEKLRNDPSQDLWLDPYLFCLTGLGTRHFRPNKNGPIHTLLDLPYKDISHYQSRQHCMLCRVVRELLQQYSQQTNTTSSLKFGPWRPFALDHADTACKASPKTAVCLLPGAILDPSTPSVPEPIVLKLSLSYRTTRFSLESITPWEPPSLLSLPSLNTWLTSCTAHHQTQCNTYTVPMAQPPGLRLIDTFTNCIVSPPSPVPYIALSYCWPPPTVPTTQLLLSTLPSLSLPNSLSPANLPPVIADAIALCRSLNHQHLWVDQLCIIQDDPVSKMGQIAAMDSIYHMADLTIIALSPVGLPGASPSRPRNPDLTKFSLWDGPLDAVFGTASSPLANSAIGPSRWDTRGWTFQERKLSRRMLLVGDTYAWLSCFQGTFWEYDDRRIKEEYEAVPTDVTVETGVNVTESFTSYAQLVIPYSARQLSFRSDVLNAFMGVGNVLGTVLASEMIKGLPERYLGQALLWRGEGFRKGWDKSLGVPSWSWAGWEGGVDYGFVPSSGRDGKGARSAMDSFSTWYSPEMGSLVTFWYTDEGGVRRVEEGRWWFSSWDMWDDEFEQHQEQLRERLRERPEDVHGAMINDAWDRCCHNPRECMRRVDISDEARKRAENVPGSLAFTTTCAMLQLRLVGDGKSDAVCFDMVDDSVDNPAMFVGQTMSMDREWADKTLDLKKKYRVAVVGAGEANRLREDSNPIWRNLSSGVRFHLALYVLVVEERNGVLFRLAVGLADLFAWTKLEPAWESVVLG